MKVFKFYVGDIYYAIASQTKELAIDEFEELLFEDYTSIEEIPESEWDEKIIKVYEDNNTETKPFKESIRDLIIGTETQVIFTNDQTLLT